MTLIGEVKYLNQMVDNDRRAERLSGLTDRIIQAYDLKMGLREIKLSSSRRLSQPLR